MMVQGPGGLTLSDSQLQSSTQTSLYPKSDLLVHITEKSRAGGLKECPGPRLNWSL